MTRDPDHIRRARQRARTAKRPGRNGTAPRGASSDGYADEELGDAWEEPPPEPSDTRPRISFDLLDSAAFSAAEYRLEWLVRRLLVRGQPAVLGGPKKSLKTSLLVDLALSLGTATPFLGEFGVGRPVRTALLSGESGEATLQETARRVAAAKGVELAAAQVLWGFRLPQLADAMHLAALQEAIQQHGIEVLLLDPLYLALLGGPAAERLSASNVYQMGPLLLGIAQTCLTAGCTPVLAHHFRLSRADPHAEPELGDLAYAGIQEYARQWILVSRRERYEPGTGEHQLWLSAGGSAGYSGLWSLDISEGVIDEDFCGRTWTVNLTTAGEAWQSEREQRESARRAEQAERDQADDAAVMAALDQLDPSGTSSNRVQTQARLSDQRMLRAVIRLRAAGVIEEVMVPSRIGSGAERQVRGLRRPRDGP